MTLLIDTAAVPASERVDFWSESAHGPYHPLQIRSAAKGKFWARMWGYELGPLGVFRIVAAGNTMIRTSRAIAAGDPECVHVGVVVAGQLNAAQSGRHCVARTGDMVSYETSHPVVLQADQPFETLVVRVPRELLGRHAEPIGKLTAVNRPGSERHPRAMAAYLGLVADRLAEGKVTPEDAPRAAEHILDLTRGLYADGAAGDAPSRSRAEILLNVESFIEANIGDPLLDPDDIAHATFISTRYLHKLFAAEGTSVCKWIRASRLEGCRRDLIDPAFRNETILSISSRWGLTGPQHFCRLFRTAYGCSPRELRREAAATAAVRGAGEPSRHMLSVQVGGAPAAQPDSSAPVLATRAVSVRFGGVHAVVDVDLDVEPGQLVGLIGPNGAGKTTFIDAITGFVPRTRQCRARRHATSPGWRRTPAPGAAWPERGSRSSCSTTCTVRENLTVAAAPPSSA